MANAGTSHAAQQDVGSRAQASISSLIACAKFVDPAIVVSGVHGQQTHEVPLSYAQLCRIAVPEATDDDVIKQWVNELSPDVRLSLWVAAVSHFDWESYARSQASDRSITTLRLFKAHSKQVPPGTLALSSALAEDTEL